MRKNYQLKTAILMSLAFLLFQFKSFSQVSAYTMTPLTGAFTPLAGGTASSLAATADDAMSTNISIGFGFTYNGLIYNDLRVSSNGFLVFGTAGTSTATNNLATATATQRPGLAPLWDDLACTSGVTYQLSGTAPNQVLTIEWLNMEWNYLATAPVISFQVKLYEGTNVIDFNYRQEATAVTPGGASIGIMGAAATDFVSLQNTSAAPTTSTVTSTNTLTTKPATDQIYRWTPPLCFGPGTSPATIITNNSAQINWTALGGTIYNVEWGIPGFTPGTGAQVGTSTGVAIGNTSATGLSASTAYSAYVQADCGGGNLSAWVGPINFTTLCNPMIAPMIEPLTVIATPTCWTQSTSTGGPWVFTGTPDIGNVAAIVDHTSGTANNYAWIDHSATDVAVSLITPIVDVTALINPEVRFWMMSHNNSGTVTPYNILYPEAFNGTVWVPLDTIQGDFGFQWVEFYYDLSAYTFSGNLVQVRFRTESGGDPDDFDNDLLLDDIAIQEGPACPAPVGLTETSSNTTSASFSWTAGGSEAEWTVEYGAVGFTPGTGTVVTPLPIVTNSTISGLTPMSFYQVYIRSICGPGDTSTYVGPIAFNTYDQGNFIEANTACPSTGFVDISASGTGLNLAEDDAAGITLPFTLLYQGTAINDVRIGNNGGVWLGTLTGGIFYTMTGGNGLYPYIQDLNAAISPGNVFHETVGTAPNRQFIVMWDNLPHWTGTDGATFELIIDEATQEFYYVYDDVMMSNAAWDFGKDAEIGIRGAQNINVSMNNATYLTDNSCAHFYYTDCPKPTNLAYSYVFADEAAISWTAGLAGETNWTVIYGPQGFDPLTSGTTITTTANSAVLIGLAQLTTYDVYVYADCNPTILQSISLSGTFQTLPYCSNPTGIVTASAVDSIFTSWSWTESSPSYPSTSFNLQYGFFGFDLYSGTTVALDNNLTDTLANTALMAGGSYQVYVQAVCGVDTSSFIGPFTVLMPITNDTVCGAEMLNVDGTVYSFNNIGSTISPLENTIVPDQTGYNTTQLPSMGWGQSTLERTTWYKFISPISGSIRFSGLDVNATFSQIAVYELTDCDDFNTFALVAASDQAVGTSTKVAPNFTICGLTPGATYYVMHDSWTSGGTPVTGNYSIKLTPINLNAGSTNGVIDVCTGDTANLFVGIQTYDAGGVWESSLPAVDLSITDSLFSTTGLAYQTFSIDYIVTDGCAADSSISLVKIWAPSTAGQDGSVAVCRNEPVDLLSGLNGTADFGGTWYNPGNQVLASSEIVSSNFQGSYNYVYITGNGICPNDTSNVLVVVNGSCNYLGLSDLMSDEMNLYPNPTTGMFNIEVNSTESFNFTITDLNGKVLVKETALKNSGVNTIDLTGVETGIYLIQVFNKESQKVFRVIKE